MTAAGPRQPLGQVLVEAGLLTEASLREALEEQRRTRRPLGEVLIRQGYVSPAAVANALADQHGGLLRTEYGIATGLRRRSGPAGADGAEPLAPPVHAGAPAQTTDAIADHVARLAQRFKEQQPIEEEAPPALRIQEPEPEPAPDATEPEPEPASAPAPDDRAPASEDLAAALDALDKLLADVEQRARDLDAIAARLEEPAPVPVPAPAAPALATVAPPAPSPDGDRHMLLVPTPNGVELVARTGAAPAPGTPLDLLVAGEAVRFVVGEIVPAPLPGPYLPCARLERS